MEPRYPEARAAANKATQKAHAEITKQAEKLAAAIEAAVSARAVQDYYASGSFYPTASIYITDAVPTLSAQQGLPRTAVPPITARALIQGVVNAVLDTTE